MRALYFWHDKSASSCEVDLYQQLAGAHVERHRLYVPRCFDVQCLFKQLLCHLVLPYFFFAYKLRYFPRDRQFTHILSGGYMFRRVLVAFAMIFAVSLASAPDLKAQYQACLPDCPADVWGPLNNTVLNVGPCQVRVYWRKRKACNTYYDVIITSVWFLNGGCGAGPNYQTLLANVTMQLLILNPMGFPPVFPGEPCEDNWRVTVGSCWYKESINGVPMIEQKDGEAPQNSSGFLMPCDEAVCCLDLYRVCLVPDGQGGHIRSITHISTNPPAQVCPRPLGGACFPVCGYGGR